MFTIWYRDSEGDRVFLSISTLTEARLIWDLLNSNEYSMVSARP